MPQISFRIRDGKVHKWGLGYVYLDYEVNGRAVHSKVFHPNLARGEIARENAQRWVDSQSDIVIALICEFNPFGALCEQTCAQGLVRHLRWVARICEVPGDADLAQEASCAGVGPSVWWEAGPSGWAYHLISAWRRPVKSRFSLRSAFGYDLWLMRPAVRF